jgi:hypothetical protein
VKVTFVPEHIVPAGLAAMDTEGVTAVFTVIVIVLDAAVAVEAHVAFEVMTHAIVLPLASVAFVYVALFTPTLVPFNFH